MLSNRTSPFLRRLVVVTSSSPGLTSTPTKRHFFLGKNIHVPSTSITKAASSYLPTACQILATNHHFAPSCYSSWRSSSGTSTTDDINIDDSTEVSIETDETEETDGDGDADDASQSPPHPILHRAKVSNLDSLPITFSDISRAHVSIRNGIVRTPCIQSPFLSEIVGANVYLKTEFRQFTGSFKERGARNAILTLLRQREAGETAGVIAASAGNHALALAYHGKELGVPVTVVMPTVAPLAKVDKCKVSILCLVACFLQRPHTCYEPHLLLT